MADPSHGAATAAEPSAAAERAAAEPPSAAERAAAEPPSADTPSAAEPPSAAERAARAAVRLDDRTVRQRLAVLDQQLAQLEDTPGPIGELALAAVSGLAEIYGQALARTLDVADPALVERMRGDELVGHLLTLHGIHPEPIEARVVRVIDGLRRAMSTQISEIELTGIDHAVAILRLSTRGCGSGSAGTEQAVRAAVLAAAPELASVAIVPAGTLTSPTFVPLDSLVRPPRPDAAKQLAATPAAKLDAAKPRLPSPRPADP